MKTTPNKTKFWRWDNWQVYLFVFVLPLLLVYLIPLIIRTIKSQLLKNQEQQADIEKTKQFNSNQDPQQQQRNANSITKSPQLQEAAKMLAHHLGTKYSDTNSMFDWLSPRGWTENDAAAAALVVRWRKYYTAISRLYTKVYTNNRSLSNDLIELLDDAELKKVRKYIKI